MAVIAIIVALLLEQWHPLSDRKVWRSAVSSCAEWLENTFNAGEERHGTIAWLVAVLPPVVGTIALYAFLVWLEPLLGLAFNIAALYVTLGFRQFSHYFTALHAALREGDLDRARQEIAAWRGEAAMHHSREEVMRLAIEEALVSSHRHVFGVLFWFVVLPGPSGAILYRLAVYLRERWGKLGVFGRTAEQVYSVLEWPAARLTAAAFAVVGDFEDAVYCWRTQAAPGPTRNGRRACRGRRRDGRSAGNAACRAGRRRAAARAGYRRGGRPAVPRYDGGPAVARPRTVGVRAARRKRGARALKSAGARVSRPRQRRTSSTV